MMELRKAAARGHSDAGSLQSWHSFSCAGYFDPAHMGFAALRVLNEDRLAPAAVLAPQRRANMEILSLVVQGSVRYRLDGGDYATLEAGDVHLLSAGRGIEVEEANASASTEARVLRLWLQPNQVNASPRGTRLRIDARAPRCVVASATGDGGSLAWRCDARLERIRLAGGDDTQLALRPGRRLWLQVIDGELMLDDLALQAGDGVAMGHHVPLALHAISASQVLLLDLAD